MTRLIRRTTRKTTRKRTRRSNASSFRKAADDGIVYNFLPHVLSYKIRTTSPRDHSTNNAPIQCSTQCKLCSSISHNQMAMKRERKKDTSTLFIVVLYLREIKTTHDLNYTPVYNRPKRFLILTVKPLLFKPQAAIFELVLPFFGEGLSCGRSGGVWEHRTIIARES